MKYPDIQIITGVIEKKGRKYYYLEGVGPTCQVLITDSIKGKKVGEKLIAEVIEVSGSSSKGKGIALKCYAPLDSECAQQQIQENNQKKIARLVAEIREGIQKGHVDSAPVAELRDLEGSEEILTQLRKEWAERKKEIDREEIERSIEYIRKGLKEGYRCPKTLARLAELGRDDLVAQFETEWEVKKAELAPEIEKCVAYIREGIEKGYECPKTMTKLRNWGCDDLVAQLEIEWKAKETAHEARHWIEKGFLPKKSMEKLKSMGCDDLVDQLEAEYAVKKAERDALKSLKSVAKKGERMEKTSLSDLLQKAEVLSHKPRDYRDYETLLIKNDEIFFIIHRDYDEKTWRKVIVEECDEETYHYYGSPKDYGYHAPFMDDLKKSVGVLRKTNSLTSDQEGKEPSDHE